MYFFAGMNYKILPITFQEFQYHLDIVVLMGIFEILHSCRWGSEEVVMVFLTPPLNSSLLHHRKRKQI